MTQEREARRIEILAELSELAMALAQQAAQQALDDPGEPKHSLTFTRLASTTKQLVALEAKLAGDGKDKTAGPTPPAHNPERARVARIVRDNLKRAIDGPRLRDVNRYLETRLNQQDVDDAIHSTQPIGVIAQTICQELAIPFDLAKQPDDVICRRPKSASRDPQPEGDREEEARASSGFREA